MHVDLNNHIANQFAISSPNSSHYLMFISCWWFAPKCSSQWWVHYCTIFQSHSFMELLLLQPHIYGDLYTSVYTIIISYTVFFAFRSVIMCFALNVRMWLHCILSFSVLLCKCHMSSYPYCLTLSRSEHNCSNCYSCCSCYCCHGSSFCYSDQHCGVAKEIFHKIYISSSG